MNREGPFQQEQLRQIPWWSHPEAPNTRMKILLKSKLPTCAWPVTKITLKNKASNRFFDMVVLSKNKYWIYKNTFLCHSENIYYIPYFYIYRLFSFDHQFLINFKTMMTIIVHYQW